MRIVLKVNILWLDSLEHISLKLSIQRCRFCNSLEAKLSRKYTSVFFHAIFFSIQIWAVIINILICISISERQIISFKCIPCVFFSSTTSVESLYLCALLLILSLYLRVLSVINWHSFPMFYLNCYNYFLNNPSLLGFCCSFLFLSMVIDCHLGANLNPPC